MAVGAGGDITAWFQLLLFTALYPGAEVFVSSVHGLCYTSPDCLIATVLSHDNATTFASHSHVSKVSQNFASIDGRGRKWRMKSLSLIDPLNLAISRNSSLGHGTKVLSAIPGYVVTRKQRWKPVWKTTLPWPHV